MGVCRRFLFAVDYRACFVFLFPGLPFFFLQSVLFCILYLLDYRLHLACFGLSSSTLPYPTFPLSFFFSLAFSYYILGLLCCLFLYFLPIRFVK